MATFTPVATPFTDAQLFQAAELAAYTYWGVLYPYVGSAQPYLMRATVIATSQPVYWPSSVPDATYAPGGSAAVTDVVIFKLLT